MQPGPCSPRLNPARHCSLLAAETPPRARSREAMAPLRFSANLSWLFPELSGFPARLRAAGSSGFEAAEIGWPYAEPPEALARAAREAGLRVVLINTPPGVPGGPGPGQGGAGGKDQGAEAHSFRRRQREGGEWARGCSREAGGLPRRAGAGGAVR